MPREQVERLYRGMHRNFKDRVWDHLARIGVVNNGGPQHGWVFSFASFNIFFTYLSMKKDKFVFYNFRVVTAELTFYLETLRSLKVLPAEELGDQTLQEVWR